MSPRWTVAALLLLLTLQARAQHPRRTSGFDTAYVHDYSHIVTGRFYLSTKFNRMRFGSDRGPDLFYLPNNRYNFGLGASYRALPEGNRVFYTALGHAQGNYTDDLLFRQHISQALWWLLQDAMAVAVPSPSAIRVFPNPANEEVRIEGFDPGSLQLLDMCGTVLQLQGDRPDGRLRTAELPNGTYLLRDGNGVYQQLLILH